MCPRMPTNAHLMTVFILTVSFIAISCHKLSHIVYADNLTSSSYKVQMSTINITGGNKAGGGYKLSDTIGQTAQGLFSGSGYKVRAGFQYIHSIVPFSFQISSIIVDLGYLTPNTFATNTNNLTVSAGGGYGYAVKAIQDHRLQLISGATIPSTACDAGTPCTISNADVWTSTTAYGLGYNMSGTDVDTADFVNSTYFRPFADNSLSESPVTVMSKNGITHSSVATVTYKVNVSPTQEAGTYSNAIQYIAIPAY